MRAPEAESTAAPDLGGVMRVGMPRWHMTGFVGQPFRTLAIDINQPSTLLHWSIFEVTVANLVLIAVMVVIFGAALLLPFPRGDRLEAPSVTGSETDGPADGAMAAATDPADDSTADMWTA